MLSSMHTPSMKMLASFMIVIMSLISFVPRVEAGFVPTDESYAEIMRSEDITTIQTALENKVVEERLEALGYSKTEIQDRLDLLTNEEVHSLATQIDTVTHGGSALGTILIVMLVVLLLIVILKLTGNRVVIS